MISIFYWHVLRNVNGTKNAKQNSMAQKAKSNKISKEKNKKTTNTLKKFAKRSHTSLWLLSFQNRKPMRNKMNSRSLLLIDENNRISVKKNRQQQQQQQRIIRRKRRQTKTKKKKNDLKVTRTRSRDYYIRAKNAKIKHTTREKFKWKKICKANSTVNLFI